MEKLIKNLKMQQAKEAAARLFPGEKWLQKEEWGERIFVSSRRKIGAKSNFKNELRDAQILRDFGSTVYLVPENTKNNEKQYDAIVDELKMEFKNMRGSSRETLIDHFYRSRKQAPNVFINLEKSSLTRQKVLKTLYRARNSDLFIKKSMGNIKGTIILKIRNIDYLIKINIVDLKI